MGRVTGPCEYQKPTTDRGGTPRRRMTRRTDAPLLFIARVPSMFRTSSLERDASGTANAGADQEFEDSHIGARAPDAVRALPIAETGVSREAHLHAIGEGPALRALGRLTSMTSSFSARTSVRRFKCLSGRNGVRSNVEKLPARFVVGPRIL